ncbi:solute carrier family 35 member G1 [Dermatophagoides farinae]|uniref:solute carrier family 35 member G1 n=1 Tax=Dermatophagoides farinae TaxID=6954 RepID=UPI003F628B57
MNRSQTYSSLSSATSSSEYPFDRPTANRQQQQYDNEINFNDDDDDDDDGQKNPSTTTARKSYEMDTNQLSENKSINHRSSLEHGSVGLISGYDETQRLVDNTHHQHHNSDIESSHQKKKNRNSNETANINSCNFALYKGIFYSSLSSVFFSLSAVIVKYLKDIHPGQLAVSRFFGIFILTIPLIVYHDLNPFGPPELRPILIMRGIAGATSLFLRFIAFHYLSIADASVIIFSVPIFVSIFAWFYLKEPCGLFHTLTIIIAMIGLIMTTKLPIFFSYSGNHIMDDNYYNYYHPSWSSTSSMFMNMAGYHNGNNVNNISSSSSSPKMTMMMINSNSTMTSSSSIVVGNHNDRLNHLYGVLAALSSLIFSSSVFIFIRKAKGAHHAVIMFNFGWVAIIETIILTTLLNGFSMPRTPFEWYLIVVLAVFSFCGQMLLTRSLQLEQAGPVSVVRATTDITLAFLWQLIIFKETPDLWSIFGALVVSSCIVLTAMRKWVLSLPEHSRIRDKLYFLLL